MGVCVPPTGALGDFRPQGPALTLGRRPYERDPPAASTTAVLPCPLTARPPSLDRRIRSDAPPVLAELAVRDLGVIEEVTLLLDAGMTALTGETGAGKTMLVGAIGLLT